MTTAKKAAAKRKAPAKKTTTKKEESASEADLSSASASEEDIESDSPPPAKKARNTAPHKDNQNGLVELIGGTDLVEELTSTPLGKLVAALQEEEELDAVKGRKDGVVVYWMRMKDLRLEDNRALALACQKAESLKAPVVVLHVLSPEDYVAHDRSPRRIDFVLRALTDIRTRLAKLNIPLHTITVDKRETVPTRVTELMKEWNASHLYGNVEYEVDELARDKEVVEKTVHARKGNKGGWDGEVAFLKDVVVVSPGELLSQQGRPYAVFSPWYNAWQAKVKGNPAHYIDDQGGALPNPSSAKTHSVLKPLFNTEVPKSIKGFELDKDEAQKMAEMWPVGEDVPDEILERFMKTKLREQVFQHAVLHDGAEPVDNIGKSRIGSYVDTRVRVDVDGTARISPYLSAGLISPRAALRATMKHGKAKTLYTDHRSGSGPGSWVSEVAWRDFYQHVLAAFPRVCRGQPYLRKYRDIVWEENETHLQAWKDGKTGVPIVDASMRALKAQGWMHNRSRMIVAMYLTKHLMINWQHGEKWFMQQLIDGDFGSNNGGWQWSSSTGTDPQPYFRIFNPTSQSQKADPDGDYIRYWVPELKKLKGKVIHEPSSALSEIELKKMGYRTPIVEHKAARARALARFKNPGDDFDGDEDD